VVIPCKPFQPDLTFVSKVGAFSAGKYLKGVPLCQAVALLANIRLGLKGLYVKNPVAYAGSWSVTKKKVFNLTPCYKTFLTMCEK
jgi:hypothetical protein